MAGRKGLSFSGEREIFKGKNFSVVQVSVRRGKMQSTWEFVKSGSEKSVGIVPLDKKGNVFLVKEFCYPVGKKETTIPKGGFEGNTPVEAVNKELSEEANLVSGKITFLGSFPSSPGYTRHHMDVYLAENLRKRRGKQDPFEILEVVRIPLGRAISLAIAGKIREPITVASLFLARESLEKRNSKTRT